MVNTKIKLIMTIVLLMILSVLLLNRAACATNHYLSAGTTGGEEDGTSLANAWKTIADIEGLASGDTVYCAGTYNAQLTVADSVSYVVIPDSTWVIDGGDSLTYGIYGNGKSGVIIDGATIQNMRKDTDGYGVYFTGGSDNTVKNCNISKIYYATNPNPGSTAWEKTRGYGIYFTKSDNPTISGNTIQDCGAYGIMVTSWSGVHVTDVNIYDNEITNINVCIGVSLADSTVAITGGSIHDNYIHDFNNYYYCDAWHRDGIFMFGRTDSKTYAVSEIEIYNNYFEDKINRTGGSTAWIYLSQNVHDINIHHNVLNDSESYYAIRIRGYDSGGIAGNNKIENNTVYNYFGGNGTGFYLSDSSADTLRNNIFYVAKQAWAIEDAYSLTGLYTSNNVVYSTGYSLGSNLYKIETSYKTFAQVQALGYEVNSINADPLFVGGTGETSFQLQADSPAIDVGADLGFTADADGDTIPQGVAPEIGAFEYNIDPTPPSDLTNTVNLPKHSVHTFVDNSSDEEGFQVMINGVVTDSLAANTETFSIDNQTPGTTYNVQIRAYKGDYLSGATVVNFTAPRYRLGRVR